jgi:hypothetical protein
MSLAIQGAPADDVCPPARFLTLGFLGVYLTIDFVVTDRDEGYPFYWFAELVHLVILTVLALGISARDVPFQTTWLFWLLTSNIVFNLSGAWDDLSKWSFVASKEVWKWRVVFALASVAGLTLLETLSGRADGLQVLAAVAMMTLLYSIAAFRKRGFWSAN